MLGPDHGVTKALARASITMAKVDLWQARLAIIRQALADARAAGLYELCVNELVADANGKIGCVAM